MGMQIFVMDIRLREDGKCAGFWPEFRHGKIEAGYLCAARKL